MRLARRRLGLFLLCFACAMNVSAKDSPEGVWHFLNDPVAQHRNGRTFLACVDWAGSPKVAAYDHSTRGWTETVLREKWKVDDHISPTLVIRDQDDRFLAFYARGSDVFYHLSEHPLDISSFGPARKLPAADGNFPRPVQIREEGKSKIFLIYRDTLTGGSKRPALRISEDDGESWSDPQALIDFGNWMYPKAIAAPDGSIHLLITSNPHHMQVNNLYHIRYHDGAFYKADGTRVAGLEELPLSEEQLDLVYASPGETGAPPMRASDLAVDAQGRPVIVGVCYQGPGKREHSYKWIRFKGESWDLETFAETEPISSHPATGWVYFGGIALDRASPERVYYSAKAGDVFEIFVAERAAGGGWSHRPITQGSKGNQLRPWTVAGLPGALIWLEGDLNRLNDYRTRVKTSWASSPEP